MFNNVKSIDVFNKTIKKTKDKKDWGSYGKRPHFISEAEELAIENQEFYTWSLHNEVNPNDTKLAYESQVHQWFNKCPVSYKDALKETLGRYIKPHMFDRAFEMCRTALIAVGQEENISDIENFIDYMMFHSFHLPEYSDTMQLISKKFNMYLTGEKNQWKQIQQMLYYQKYNVKLDGRTVGKIDEYLKLLKIDYEKEHGVV